ncbi:tetratricopeptide repeat-containing sensor histidine kinase [Mucilaginibacter sp. OK098]|uniref:tetratricopeptide repeat-containing sensor histidine kinase n=1 Tax=Mucilaginibacter sp. OK098 TaxID=1855297 RepID=UPI0009121290|nr:tetratricopeptide repeat-containing sensor histidine kinase [Mucilaginibacter sp. OK098]SHN37296.1 Tetratricopeptide repeat-containing protein [Mucilaginibacter sp. OK098]
MSTRGCIFYLCFLLLCFTAISQPVKKNIALLEKKIALCKDDTNKVLLYMSLADTLNRENFPDTAFIIDQKAWLLAGKLKYSHGLVLSLIKLGSFYEVTKKDYAEAISYYKKAIKISETQRLYTDIHLSYGCLLNMYYYFGDYPGAMAIAQKGLVFAERQNDKEKLAHYNNQFGFIYLKQEKPAESIKYYGQYLKLAMQIGSPAILADSYNCMADAYLLENDYKAALHYHFTALGLYKKINSGQTPNKNNRVHKSDRVIYTLFKISNAYKLQGHYQLSLQYALKGFSYINENGASTGNPYDLASYYITTGEVYMALKDYTHAMQFLNNGLSLSKAIRHREDILEAYSGLSKIFVLQKRYDNAYHYQELYVALKDSMISEKVSRAIEQVRSSFESDRKDREIALLNQRQKLKETESENKSLFLNIVVGFFTLLAVISYLILYIDNTHKKQKQAQEKQLAVQNERQRISGDMHDDIGTGLSTMLIYVNLLKSKLSGKLEYPDIERVASLGDELVAQMKEIVWSLNPDNDSLESLLIFIRQYFAQLFEPMPYRTSIVFPSVIPAVALKGVIRRNVYLSIKETLNNVIKHANADWVELKVQLDPDKLIISIKDNGTGFPCNSDGKLFGNGLKNIQRRMDKIDGKFQFLNDGGTLISIELNL